VYVADTGNNRIVRFSAAGSKELEWGRKGSAPGELYEPGGLAVNAGGRVFVCDNSNGRLVVFDADGAFRSSFEVPGWRREVFSEPYVALAADGTIWVTVPLAREVRAYSEAGKLLRTIGPNDVPGVELKRPSGLAFRPTDGRLLVSDIDGQVAVLNVTVPSTPPSHGPEVRRPPHAVTTPGPMAPQPHPTRDEARPLGAPLDDAARRTP
jgi:DNA-binding beta-propeller fold protein YncE